MAGVDLGIVFVVLAFVVFAAVHATLVEGIRHSAPDLAPKLGWFGPGYWLGVFWFRPVYRRFLRAGQFDADLSAHPKLLRLAQVERLLWYLSVVAIAAAFIF